MGNRALQIAPALAAIRLCTRREQLALAGKYFDGLSVREMARRWGVTCAAIRKRLSRAIQKLRAFGVEVPHPPESRIQYVQVAQLSACGGLTAA
jgi:DNA-directed RNA polymerase specialized sigma24 family protein